MITYWVCWGIAVMDSIIILISLNLSFFQTICFSLAIWLMWLLGLIAGKSKMKENILFAKNTKDEKENFYYINPKTMKIELLKVYGYTSQEIKRALDFCQKNKYEVKHD